MTFEAPKEKEILEKDLIAKTTETIPAGQEWHVKQLLKSEIVIKAGAKLIVTEIAAKNKIIVEEGGELKIVGQDLKNEITNGQESPEEIRVEDGKEKIEPQEMDFNGKDDLELAEMEIDNLLKFGPETIERMETAALLFKKLVESDKERIKYMEELFRDNLIDKPTLEKRIKEIIEVRINILLKVLKWPESGRATIKELLKYDQERERPMIETFVADWKNVDAFLKTGRSVGLDANQIKVLNAIKKARGL